MTTPYCPYCSAKTLLLDHTPDIQPISSKFVPVGGIIACKNCRSKFVASAWITDKNLISC